MDRMVLLDCLANISFIGVMLLACTVLYCIVLYCTVQGPHPAPRLPGAHPPHPPAAAQLLLPPHPGQLPLPPAQLQVTRGTEAMPKNVTPPFRLQAIRP